VGILLEQGNSGSLSRAMGLMEDEIMDSQEDLENFLNPEEIEGSEHSLQLRKCDHIEGSRTCEKVRRS
jgi:hypothetical protein